MINKKNKQNTIIKIEKDVIKNNGYLDSELIKYSKDLYNCIRRTISG